MQSQSVDRASERAYPGPMTPSLSDLFAQARAGAVDIPDGWKQGRTGYGGLSAAILLERARAAVPGLPPLRSALVNFTGPVSGTPELSATVLRQGRNVTTVEAKARVEGGVVCAATFSFGASRDSRVSLDCPAPDAAAPEDCAPFAPPGAERFVPAFFARFDTRRIAGAPLVSGASEGYVRAWSRHVDAEARTGESALLCLADVLPPAAMPMMAAPAPISSMSWICNILRPPETDDGWYMVESDLSAAGDGYTSQVMHIWNTRGQLVVEGMQSIVVFG